MSSSEELTNGIDKSLQFLGGLRDPTGGGTTNMTSPLDGRFLLWVRERKYLDASERVQGREKKKQIEHSLGCLKGKRGEREREREHGVGKPCRL